MTLIAAPTLVGNGTSGIPNIGIINNPVFAFATAGHKFRVRAELGAPGFTEFSCHISGQQKP